MATLSPCVGLCQLDSSLGLCTGCARSGAEIGAWQDASPAVLARVWADLPRRRVRLGIGLHRLNWSTEQIVDFVLGSIRVSEGAWVLGGFGAFAPFTVGRDEACAVDRDGATITAVNTRGAIRFEIHDRVRALSLGGDPADPTQAVIILAVPRSRNNPRPNADLTTLGADRDAIRPTDRLDRLYDLGANSEAGACCVRTASPDLTTELDRQTGRNWTQLSAATRDWPIDQTAARVVVSAVGRSEAFTSIAPHGDLTAPGSWTRLFPDFLALGRETPPGIDVPNSFVPCAIYDPGLGQVQLAASSVDGRINR